MDIMDLDDTYENVQIRKIQGSTGPQTLNHNQDERKDQKQSARSRCVLVMTVSLGLICVLLLLVITLQHISITAERDLYKNTVEELNHTISGLQHNNTDLKTEKQQLRNSFNSLNQEKLELETRVNDLSTEKNQIESRSDSLNQEKLKLETKVTSLSDELKKKTSKLLFFLPSSELKSWFESRQYCRDRGADLVIIKSKEKQEFITSLVKERVWIGLSGKGSKTWVDNSPLNEDIKFWSDGEPNGYNRNEDCTELNAEKTNINNWNDLYCSEKRKWICEN